MFQFGLVSSGFAVMFGGLTLCVFGFSFIRAHSLFGSAFALFVLGLVFLTEMLYFSLFGQSLTIGTLILTDWQLSILLPVSVVVVVLILVIGFSVRRRRMAQKSASRGSNQI